MEKITIEVKDKEGVRLIEIDPSKKYILTFTNDVLHELTSPEIRAIGKALSPFLATKYFFALDNLNEISLAEAKNFLQILQRKAG